MRGWFFRYQLPDGGFYFLAKWREVSGFEIPEELETEVKELASRQMASETLQLKSYNLFDKRSYNPNPDGTWAWGSASEIDLMKAVSFNGSLFCDFKTQKTPKLRVLYKFFKNIIHTEFKHGAV